MKSMFMRVLTVFCAVVSFQAYGQSPVDFIVDSKGTVVMQASSTAEATAQEAVLLSKRLDSLELTSAKYADVSHTLEFQVTVGGYYDVADLAQSQHTLANRMQGQAESILKQRYPHLESQPGFKENLASYIEKATDTSDIIESRNQNLRNLVEGKGRGDVLLNDSTRNLRRQFNKKFLSAGFMTAEEKAAEIALKTARVTKGAVVTGVALGVLGAYTAIEKAKTPASSLSAPDSGLVANLRNAASAADGTTDTNKTAQALRD